MPKFNSLKPGDPIKMLANDKLYLTNTDGQRLGAVIAKLEQKGNERKSNYNVKMAYHYFSDVDKDDEDDENKSEFEGNCFYDCMSDTNPNITYYTTINLRAIYNALMALIDGGANGCIGGKDMTLLYNHLHHKRVNVGVVNGHQMTNLRLAVIAAYIKTQSGPIIGIFNNVAVDAKLDQSILSRIQMRAANNFISDVRKCFGGLQMIETNSNHKIPIKFTTRLPLSFKIQSKIVKSRYGLRYGDNPFVHFISVRTSCALRRWLFLFLLV